MADAERLMNLMESFDYKSEQYNVCRKALLTHLAQKPDHDDDSEAWTMTGPAPFELEVDVTPAPKKAKRSTRKPKASQPDNSTASETPPIKPKRVRKKTS
jgi:hypothetical protein